MSGKMTLTQAHALKTKNISIRQGKKTFYVKIQKYKSRLLHTLKPKTQQHSVGVKVKNQTDTKFKFLNNII